MLPVMYPRTTNSIGNTSHRFMTVTLGSGLLSHALGTMCSVRLNHHAEVWLRTAPLNGMLARWRSNALWRSVVTASILSSATYVSRTLPSYFSPIGRSERVTQLLSARDAAAACFPSVAASTGESEATTRTETRPGRERRGRARGAGASGAREAREDIARRKDGRVHGEGGSDPTREGGSRSGADTFSPSVARADGYFSLCTGVRA